MCKTDLQFHAMPEDIYKLINNLLQDKRYTINAKKAYEKGMEICPVAGWNIYELIDEQELK